MKRSFLPVILPVLVLPLLSCQLFRQGKDSSDKGPQKNEKSSVLTYSFEQNGCKTGEHSFSTHEEYCSGLLNDSLNNHCAYSLRVKAYQEKCDSSFDSGDPNDTGDNGDGEATPTPRPTSSTDVTDESEFKRTISWLSIDAKLSEDLQVTDNADGTITVAAKFKEWGASAEPGFREEVFCNNLMFYNPPLDLCGYRMRACSLSENGTGSFSVKIQPDSSGICKLNVNQLKNETSLTLQAFNSITPEKTLIKSLYLKLTK